MLNLKSVSTPMALNEKLKVDDGSKKVDEGIYRSLIGSLLYLTHTRPNIMQAVSMLSRFISSLSTLHYSVAKKVLRYEEFW